MLGNSSSLPEDLKTKPSIDQRLREVLSRTWPLLDGVGFQHMIQSSPNWRTSPFWSECAAKGTKWLSEHPETKRPKDFWKHCREELATAFHNRCAYSAIEITYGGTVDHFLSCKHHRHLAYEWTNYRYCFGSINSTKQNLDEQILDPFEIGDDWFETVIPGFMLKPTDKVPETFYAKAKGQSML